MKKQLSVFLTVVLAFGLAVAAYAYNQPNTTPRLTKAECCKNSDSCPTKGKTAEKSSCCDKSDCCCNNGNCAKMKEKGGNASTDSCPMKKSKENQSPAASVSTDGQNCCNGCECCNGGDCCKKSKTS